MSDNASPFDQNADLARMRQDIADRAYRVRMTGFIITAAFLVAAVAAAFFFAPMIGGGMGKPIISLALMAGGAVTSLVTMREAKKLEIDQDYLQSYMQGKNYWGAGYRQEVAEHGYAGPSLLHSAPPPARTHSNQR